MTLGNMRANGVRSLDVSCWQCHSVAPSRHLSPETHPRPCYSITSSATRVAYSKNSSSTFLTYKVSSMRQPTPWRIIRRVR
jgi:hypothetical protein